jgi:hypothetical protein
MPPPHPNNPTSACPRDVEPSPPSAWPRERPRDRDDSDDTCEPREGGSRERSLHRRTRGHYHALSNTIVTESNQGLVDTVKHS